MKFSFPPEEAHQFELPSKGKGSYLLVSQFACSVVMHNTVEFFSVLCLSASCLFALFPNFCSKIAQSRVAIVSSINATSFEKDLLNCPSND